MSSRIFFFTFLNINLFEILTKYPSNLDETNICVLPKSLIHHQIPAVHEREVKRSLTWTGAQGVPLHALAEGEGGHVGVGVHALLHVAAPHALGAAAARALAARGPQGARRPALLGTVVGCGAVGVEWCELWLLGQHRGNRGRQ